MADPFTGEIKMFGGNYAPRLYSICAGQVLSVSQQGALFSLLKTYYGGDGVSNFCLPDLRGRTPVGMGGSYFLGYKGGNETVPLTADHVPSHNHTLKAVNVDATTNVPTGRCMAKAACYSDPTDLLTMNSGSISAMQHAHSNIQPSIAMSYIIALAGTYPPRT